MQRKTGQRAFGRFRRKKVTGTLMAIILAVAGAGIWVGSSAMGATTPSRVRHHKHSHSRHVKAAVTAKFSGTSTPAATAPTSADYSGTVHTGEGTWYGATGLGNCSYDPTSDIGITALNGTDYAGSAMCGAYLDVKGPRGEITVKVVDNCPGCHPGDLDLSEGAFARIAGDPGIGQVPISWTLVSPDISGPVSYRYKDGSSQWWCGIQVRNQRNPIAKLEVMTSSGWLQLQREAYNYFVSQSGVGCGSEIRITDIYGQALIDSGIALTADVDQPGAAQFAKHS